MRCEFAQNFGFPSSLRNVYRVDKLRRVMQKDEGEKEGWFNQGEGRRERVHRERSLRKAEEGQVRLLLRERRRARARLLSCV